MGQSIIVEDTVLCRSCGTFTNAGRAICEFCNAPLTAYGGEVQGISETERALAALKIGELTKQPTGVVAMTAFNVFFALFWPLAFVIGSFVTRTQVNAEGTNYLPAAFSAVGPFLAAFALLPAAVALCVVAWATWTQRPWAWTANLAVLGLFAATVIIKGGFMALVWLALAGSLAFLWFQPETKRWFGQTNPSARL